MPQVPGLGCILPVPVVGQKKREEFFWGKQNAFSDPSLTLVLRLVPGRIWEGVSMLRLGHGRCLLSLSQAWDLKVEVETPILNPFWRGARSKKEAEGFRIRKLKLFEGGELVLSITAWQCFLSIPGIDEESTIEIILIKPHPNFNALLGIYIIYVYIYIYYSRCAQRLGCAMGGQFNFLLTPLGGWGVVKSIGLGVFLVQNRRFLVIEKCIWFEFCLWYLNLAPHFDCLAPNIWILAPIFWRQNLEIMSFQGEWRGGSLFCL